MGIKRVVDTSFWTDGKVENFTPEDRYFMLYLLTNPNTTQLGIYEISIKRAAFEMGYSMDAVSALIERFEFVHGVVIYSKETNEIAIKNFLRHSIIKGGAPVRDLLIKEMKAVKNKALISKVFKHIKSYNELNTTVKNIIADYDTWDDTGDESTYESYHDLYNNENDNENENDNDNENENGSAVAERPVPPPPDPKPEPTKPVRHKYGEYKNVLLTDEELEKLKSEFPADWKQRIERLSSYMASKGAKYKNHLATIRNWARRDKEQQAAKSAPVDYGNPEDFYR